MDALTSFIIVIIAITIQFSLFTIKRLQEPLETNYLIDQNSKKIKNYLRKYWKNAEITNGRLAMIGFSALILNYGFFGSIIPGFI
ncbi:MULTISPECIES: chlorophyll a/b-binding protein [Prochlorococcus]|uniref:chlorophyll a/b-binding protein n=1 Tax=Prochlorococcus TaxID=1218 RepID=UPI0005177A29|nr:chlorophyll a/b-binding protein [Prochlorococcus marinus]